MKVLLAVIVLSLVGVAHAENEIDAKVQAALADESRPAEDRERDRNRRPLDTLKFFGMKDNMRVLELLPGGGWYTRVLAPVLAGLSLRAAAKAAGLSRHTARRWRAWLAGHYEPYALVLRSRFADLGRADGWRAFWAHCLATLGLGPAMGWLDRSGVRVP